MLNIALIEPEIPQNTGNIARTCSVAGMRLHLVEPLGFRIDDRQLKRAGLDYWHSLNITYYSGTEEFFEQNKKARMHFFTTKAPRLYTDAEYRSGDFLVFGKETAGLGDAIISQRAGECVRLPMSPEKRSLNLSNAVAIASYEALRRLGFPGMS